MIGMNFWVFEGNVVRKENLILRMFGSRIANKGGDKTEGQALL